MLGENAGLGTVLLVSVLSRCAVQDDSFSRGPSWTSGLDTTPPSNWDTTLELSSTGLPSSLLVTTSSFNISIAKRPTDGGGGGGGEQVEAETELVVESRNLAACSIGLVCNCLALAGLVRCKDFNVQFKMHVVSVTVVDLFVNVFMLIVSVSRGVLKGLSPTFCVTFMSLAFCAVFANPPLVFMLALDRMGAVFAPLTYKTHSRPVQRAGLLITVALILTVAVTLATFIHGPEATPYCYAFDVMSDVGFVLSGVMTVFCSCGTVAIYVALICKLTLCRRRSVTVQPPFIRPPVPRKEVERTRQVTVRSTVLVAWFCLSYLPFGVYMLYVGVAKVDPASEVGTLRFVILTFSPFFNAIVDPFVFFWSMGAPRAVMKAVRRRLGMGGRQSSKTEDTARNEGVELRTLSNSVSITEA